MLFCSRFNIVKIWVIWSDLEPCDPPTKSNNFEDIEIVSEDRELASEILMQLWSDHDSQARSHKGNERKKGQSRVNGERDQTGVVKMDPRVCSKIVSIIVKDADGLDKAVARKHRWNINIKLNLKKLTVNTQKHLTRHDQNLYQCGEVSKDNPLQNGRFAVVIKNSVC